MNWLWLAVGLSVVVSLLALWLAALSFRASHRQLDRMRHSQKRLESELAVSNSAAIGMGNRLLAMEKRVTAHREAGGGSAASDGELPYTEASQLFQMGHDAEEVARRCGLSRAEASLLQTMQEHNPSTFRRS